MAYVEQVLVPTLKSGGEVIMDNLGSHEAKAVGAKLLFLSTHSPDLNPIEQAIAKLKHLLRRAQERTTEDIWRRTGALLGNFTHQECRYHFVNAR